MTRRRSQLLAQVVLRGLLLAVAVLGVWVAYDALASSSAQADARGSGTHQPAPSVTTSRDTPDDGTATPSADPAPTVTGAAEETKDRDKTAKGRDKTAQGRDKAAKAGDKAATGRDKAAKARDKAAKGRDGAAKDCDKAAKGRDKAAKARDGAAEARDGAAEARDGAAEDCDKAAKGRDRPTKDCDKAAKDRKADDRPSKGAGGNGLHAGVLTGAGSAPSGQGANAVHPDESSTSATGHRPPPRRAVPAADPSDDAPRDRNDSPGAPAPADTAPAVISVGGTDSGSRPGFGVSADAGLQPWAMELAPGLGVPSMPQDLAGRSPAPGTRPD